MLASLFQILISVSLTAVMMLIAVRTKSFLYILLTVVIFIGFDLRAVLVVPGSDFLISRSFGSILLSQSDLRLFVPIFYISVVKATIIVFSIIMLRGSRSVGNVELSGAPATKSRLYKISIAIYIASALSYIIVLTAIFGSPLEAFASLQRRAIVFGSQINFARIFLFLATSALLVAGVISRERGGSYRLLVIALVSIHASLVFLTGARGLSIVQFAAVMYSTGIIDAQRLYSIRNIALGIFGAIASYAALVFGLALRISAQSGESLPRALAEVSSRGTAGLLNNFNYFELFSAAVLFAERNGINFGQNFLNVLLRPVPRSLWPDKPLGVGLQMREEFYGDRLSGVPPTFLGEFYIAFGGLGMILVGAIIVLSIAFVQRNEFKSRNPYLLGFLSLFVFSLPMEMMKAGFEIVSIYYVYYAVGFALIWFVHTVFSWRRAGAPSRPARSFGH
ncbi:oligosaccharide repeat unit polymerase [Oceanicaulis sp. LC35]|uniref:oligosaccharide repeat unit polymerase n=1 Tax=Oceanicaulis sp. LC35 TaxID=3349635 RepID=UPI003F863001